MLKGTKSLEMDSVTPALNGPSPQGLRSCAADRRTPQEVPVVKNLPASAGDVRDMGSIPGSGLRARARTHTHTPDRSWTAHTKTHIQTHTHTHHRSWYYKAILEVSGRQKKNCEAKA